MIGPTRNQQTGPLAMVADPACQARGRAARTWASLRMEIWATILGAEVAVATIAILCYDWRLLLSPLP